MDSQNYYEVLAVPSSASSEELESALRKQRARYRKLTNHPDRAKAREGEDHLDLLDQIEKILLDPSARVAYDQSLNQQSAPRVMPRTGYRSSYRPPSNGKSREDRLRADMHYAWEHENWNSLTKFAQDMLRVLPEDTEAWEKLAAAYLWGGGTGAVTAVEMFSMLSRRRGATAPRMRNSCSFLNGS